MLSIFTVSCLSNRRSCWIAVDPVAADFSLVVGWVSLYRMVAV
jgi:hypothetical protein